MNQINAYGSGYTMSYNLIRVRRPPTYTAVLLDGGAHHRDNSLSTKYTIGIRTRHSSDRGRKGHCKYLCIHADYVPHKNKYLPHHGVASNTRKSRQHAYNRCD